MGCSTCIGIDAGRSGAVAVVVREGQRFRLLYGVATWSGSGPKAWHGNWHNQALWVAKKAAIMAADQPGSEALGPLVALEVPANGGKSRGGIRALGLGKMQGLGGFVCGAVCSELLGAIPVYMDSGHWPKVLRLPVKKSGLGLHRLAEIRGLMDTSAMDWGPEPVAGSNAELGRRVAIAEAGLVAMAALLEAK